MPPNEPCPHCGELILDWHNEWYEAAQRQAIYSGQAAMDCPLCRHAVLWFESRNITAPPGGRPLVYKRSAVLAALWVPVRETTSANLSGYIGNHAAGRQYRDYWPQSDVQLADQQVTSP